MDLFNTLGVSSGTWVSEHLSTIALMLVATALVVYGSMLNSVVRGVVAPFHLIIRVSAFVLLCTFGYGLLTVFLVPWVAKAIALVPDLFRLPAVAAVFIALGLVAERKRV